MTADATRNAGRRPIRVCILAPSLDIVGGQSRQAVRLMTGLRQESSLRVGFIPHNPRLPGPLRALQRPKYVRTVVTTLLYWFHLLTRLWRYDVVHVFSASYYSYLLSVAPAILIGKAYGKRVLLNYRSGEAEDHLTRWKRSAVPVMRLADSIVVPSGYLVDVFAKFGLRARPIFNVVELDAFRFRERCPMRPVFLTSRGLEPLYNVPCVLRAFQLVQRRHPDASLTITGDGSLRATLETMAADLGLRNTRFIGAVAFEKMPDLYDAADVYLAAPDLDNMPATIIECLACGLPVVTTDAGGIPYLVRNGETALIVPRGDHEALAANALRLLSDHGLAQRLARNGREACGRFTWDAVRAEWLAEYRRLAEVRGRMFAAA